MSTITMHIIGHHLPGRQFFAHDAVHVGLQGKSRDQILDLVPGDASEARFTLALQVILEGEEMDFRGPSVQGKRGARFIYLSWGQLHPDGRFEMFRRAKLFLSALQREEVAQAVATGAPLEGLLSLTDSKGGPLCASVRPPWILWQVGTSESSPNGKPTS